MAHVLVTNDFPPKIGGIQSYLYELWRRLPPAMATVYTTPHPGAAAFDRQQPFRVVRSRQRLLLPTPATARSVARLVEETGSRLVVLDPALPLGSVGRRLSVPYCVVAHGAEVTVPSRLPFVDDELARVLRQADWIIAAGSYPAAQVRRSVRGALPPLTELPPGVDTDRFRPLSRDEVKEARQRLGLPTDALVVMSISRLVPRKGMDVLIRAVARLARTRRDLVLAIGGRGRDEKRLRAVAALAGLPVRFLGRLSDTDLPLAYAVADVYAMCCRDRWWGLEQEGFGIVFLEAAAAGVPQVAGLSGGSADAVVDGTTGFVVGHPESERAVAAALEALLDDESLRQRFGAASRARAEGEFSYDGLARRLERTLREAGG